MVASERTIFVVDDDRGLLRLIEKALQREGFSTAKAVSGQAATTWLAQHEADLMLLDLKLQDVEGKALVDRLKTDNRCPPFIIITGQGDERVAVEMMKSGAVDYLVKDVDFLQFIPAVVKRALEQLDNNRRLKQLEKEILEISDRERHRIGHDLHDGLCQELAGIELMSQVLEQKLAAKSKSDAARVAEIGKYVREAISHTRLLARGLSPVTLESEGLMSALQELAGSTEKMFGIRCRFECEAPVLIDDLAIATHLYRIAQEAVSNAIKHGKAKQVIIRLEEKAATRLTVHDDGSGFPKNGPSGKGMGLRIMQYRAGIVNASVSIEANETGGTTVTCSVPRRTAQRRQA
jgi:signal transduction histidine kinase